jgi:phosphatidylethanolamine-binding protein (PEBP) family uncharacterized protein
MLMLPLSIYAGIPAQKTRIEPKDFEVANDSQFLLKGGFHYGANRRNNIYTPPRPLINHGPHRCMLLRLRTSASQAAPEAHSWIVPRGNEDPDFYQIIALNAPLSREVLKTKVTKEKLAEEINGKVIAWGNWVAVAERKWE